MDQLFIERLLRRDRIEGNFNELFNTANLVEETHVKKDNSQNSLKATISRLRKELKDKENEIMKLKEVIEVKKKDSEKLNNELISVNIENNLTRKRFAELEDEHNKLVKRWMAKVQQDVDKLNAHFERTS